MGGQQSTPVPSIPAVPATPTLPPLPVESVPTSAPSQATAPTCPISGQKATEDSKCPVKNVPSMFSFTSSSPAPAASSGGCPVKQTSEPAKKADESSGCPVKSQAPSTSAPISECPVSSDVYKNPNVYNVYNQKIDPTNQMPATANQLPAPGQSVPLPVERQSSTIPKGGTESTWLYPSPQMFWNALVRKNKVEGVSEKDIEDVVRIHNNMNETTWKDILEWERLYPVTGPGREPRLLRFLGRPQELSPLARLKMLFGHPAPFDRHDWFVDRGGEEIRYVIDYYHDEANADNDKAPVNLHDRSSIKSIKVDVRPALDSPKVLLDRIISMPYRVFLGKTNYHPLPLLPPKVTLDAEAQRVEKIHGILNDLRTNCQRFNKRLAECKSEEECTSAAIALQRCSAGVICPSIAAEFDKCMAETPVNEDKINESFTSIVKCLELFQMDSKNILKIDANKKK